MTVTARQPPAGLSAHSSTVAITAVGAISAAIYLGCAGRSGSGGGCTPWAASSATGEGCPPSPRPKGCAGCLPVPGALPGMAHGELQLTRSPSLGQATQIQRRDPVTLLKR